MASNNEVLANKIRAGVYGLAVGDALGVPVEFFPREQLRQHPVTQMTGNGTHHQPAGTWSDDTSLVLATMAGIDEYGVDQWQVMSNFQAWLNEGKFTPHGEVFDVGGTTRQAITRFTSHGLPDSGGSEERDNGNGSLMRILPIAFIFHENKLDRDDWWIVSKLASLTHAHPRSVVACQLYVAVLMMALHNNDNSNQMECVSRGVNNLLSQHYQSSQEQDVVLLLNELPNFSNLLTNTSPFTFNEGFSAIPESVIKADGYVVNTLEAALWCFVTTTNYRDCVLKAVNLGEDTDTVAAVAGGLAGIYYGFDNIPSTWVEQLVATDQIDQQITRFTAALLKPLPRIEDLFTYLPFLKKQMEADQSWRDKIPADVTIGDSPAQVLEKENQQTKPKYSENEQEILDTQTRFLNDIGELARRRVIKYQDPPQEYQVLGERAYIAQSTNVEALKSLLFTTIRRAYQTSGDLWRQWHETGALYYPLVRLQELLS